MKGKTELIIKLLAVAWIFAATLITISSIKENLPSEFWRDSWDFIKLIVGPAIGAGIAFYVNDYVHKQRKKDQERTAIYGASYAIGSMLEDFLNVRVVFRDMLADAAEGFASDGITDAPLVAYVKPQIATFLPKNGINLLSIHFLLHAPEGKEAFQKLQHLERIYQHLIDVHGLYNEAVLERQTKLATASDEERKNKNEVEIIGLKTYHSVMDFLIAVVEHIQNDEREYIEASNLLASAADAYLHEMTPLKHRGYKNTRHLEENLRPLPPPIASALKYGA
ncbi:hypothetical protein hmeg3_19080 [Herbaspirillum sp. meg3]|uniref:hypothetical protein n=1 Tax=Herbaspirillum sp. meg3 TaxID=2025949 RepID=UPI000B98552F|nr:hypothetical protein [Herbaspirillum sp. meg3]ASU40184.1 hypothetical protein hmeg3_19080 [Herbaspirillum sp. meg3]